MGRRTRHTPHYDITPRRCGEILDSIQRLGMAVAAATYVREEFGRTLRSASMPEQERERAHDMVEMCCRHIREAVCEALVAQDMELRLRRRGKS